MKAVGRDEVRGLKLPVGEGAIDHFEAQRDPLDGLERAARGIRRRRPASGAFSFITISGSIFGENIRPIESDVSFVAA